MVDSILDKLIPNRQTTGDHVLHYAIRRRLGEGGMGCVYEAFDERLQRVVAIKVLKPHLAEHADARNQFVNEARAMAAIRHENIVTVFAVEDSELPFIVMERLEGESLAERMQRSPQGAEPLKTLEAVRIGQQIAAGLAAAHGVGVLHRDIKPQNIWMEQNNVKLLDFGLAVRHAGRKAKVEGTPSYIAPEQVRGEPIDKRTDLYSVGVVLFRMLSGRLPFASTNKSATLVAVATQNAPSLGSVAANCPIELVTVVDQLLSSEPDRRIQSASGLVEQLQLIERSVSTGFGGRLMRAICTPAAWGWMFASLAAFFAALLVSAMLLPSAVANGNGSTQWPSNNSAQPELTALRHRSEYRRVANLEVQSQEGDRQRVRFEFKLPPSRGETLVDAALVSRSAALAKFDLFASTDVSKTPFQMLDQALTEFDTLSPVGTMSYPDPRLGGSRPSVATSGRLLSRFILDNQSGDVIVLFADVRESEVAAIHEVQLVLEMRKAE